LFGYTIQTARHSTLLQSASAPTVQAALPAVCWNRWLWIPTGCCDADHDSGRGTGQESFDPKDASFRRAPYPPLPHGGQASPYGLRLYYRVKAGALQNYGGQVMGVSFQKRHRLTFYGTLVRAVISGVNSPRRDSLSWCQASIYYTGRLFAGMGAFDFFGRSLDAIFEKRSPWQTLRVGILYCLNVCAIMERSGNPGLITAQEPVWEPVPQQPPRVF
jgi:hypothetical protein